VAQLASTHPLVFAALASGYGPLELRAEVVRRAVAGFPLAEVIAPLELANCLKKIPPEACRVPLHGLHWMAGAERLIAPFVPCEPRPAGIWLAATGYAYEACDERFAFWIARQRELLACRSFVPALLLPLAVYAWHSETAERDPYPTEIRPWTPRCDVVPAIRNATHWLQYVTLLTQVGRDGLTDTWLCAGTSDRYRFEPLATPAQIVAEARAMRNCVASYGDALSVGACRLFSVTENGQRVATLEVIACGEPPEFLLNDIKGPNNRACPREIERAACRWLRAQAPYATKQDCSRAPCRSASFRKLIVEPYLDSIAPDRPPGVDRMTLGGLEIALRQLMRAVRAGARLRTGVGERL
jgi:hypothetical protein